MNNIENAAHSLHKCLVNDKNLVAVGHDGERKLFVYLQSIDNHMNRFPEKWENFEVELKIIGRLESNPYNN